LYDLAGEHELDLETLRARLRRMSDEVLFASDTTVASPSASYGPNRGIEEIGIVHVPLFLEFSNKKASTIPTVHQAGVSEIVLHFLSPVSLARIQ
jgi:hypothetical protein